MRAHPDNKIEITQKKAKIASKATKKSKNNCKKRTDIRCFTEIQPICKKKPALAGLHEYIFRD